MQRIYLLISLLVTSALLLPASGQARPGPIVGIGDQSAEMFGESSFTSLGLRQARLIVPYDTVAVRGDREVTDTWVASARATGVNPLVSFEHSRVNPTKVPSVAEYMNAFRAFRQRYPSINTYSAWNEANHQSQPTFHRAKLAAQYYNAMRANCPRCNIVALDVLDQGGMLRYVKTFQKFAKKPKIWGLHNYRDTNRFHTSGTETLLAATKGKGQIWLTETGGIVKFADVFPYDEQRAAKALNQMFALSALDPRIKRLYIYSWTGEQRSARFDAGLVGPGGKPRAGYYVVKKNVAGGKQKLKRKLPKGISPKLKQKLFGQKPSKQHSR